MKSPFSGLCRDTSFAALGSCLAEVLTPPERECRQTCRHRPRRLIWLAWRAARKLCFYHSEPICPPRYELSTREESLRIFPTISREIRKTQSYDYKRNLLGLDPAWQLLRPHALGRKEGPPAEAEPADGRPEGQGPGTPLPTCGAARNLLCPPQHALQPRLCGNSQRAQAPERLPPAQLGGETAPQRQPVGGRLVLRIFKKYE